MPKLDKLFNPDAIAVVGVSTDINKLGSVIYQNIVASGYTGKLYPVNPKYPVVFDTKCYESVAHIQGKVDMAVIVVPAPAVVPVMRDVAEKKVKFAVIISAGFRETGEDGTELEKEVLQIAKQHDIRILGPNCLGINVPGNNLNATFANGSAAPGNIAFLSQSGAVNTAMLDMALESGIGFSHFVSIGNKIDLNELDFLAEWISDPNVKAIGMYLEQFADGRDFVDMIANTLKPVVILHPGQSTESRQAMASHTGALAGSSTIIHTALQQSGAIEVDSIEKMHHTLALLAYSHIPAGNKVAVVTNAGGPGIMITDGLVASGLTMAKLSKETQKLLRKALPSTASTHNPVDLVGDALADRYRAAVDAVVADPEVDSLVVVVTPQLVTQIEETARVIADISKQNLKPIIPLFIGGKFVEAGIHRLTAAGIPAFKYPEQAIDALAAVSRKHHKVKARVTASPGKYVKEIDAKTGSTLKALDQELTEQLAHEFGLVLPAQAMVSSLELVLGFVAKHHFPVVLKADSVDIVHKTDVKAVYAGINSLEELHHAYHELVDTVSRSTGKATPHILIQEQIVGGEELLIGAKRDGGADVYEESGIGFGHLLVFGKGGIYTEMYNDIASAVVPISTDSVRALIKQPKVGKIIAGTRGKEPLNAEHLVRTINSIQQMLLAYPQIESLDINPAILTREKCFVVDLKVFMKQ